jgi:MFS family permease
MSERSGVPQSKLAWFVVAILVLLYAFSVVDRLALSIMVDEIRSDLRITDTEFGLLGGLSFAAFYTLMGLPIGGLVDRYSRRWIIYLGVSAWSLASAAGAFASNYTQFFFARMGVGVGEAALSPAAYSLLGDIFPKHRLSGPTSLFAMGSTLGVAFSFAVGGPLLQYFTKHHADLPLALSAIPPWRSVLLTLSLPGLLLAFLAFAFREPARSTTDSKEVSWAQCYRYLATNRTLFLRLFAAFAIVGMVNYGLALWTAAYVRRVFAMSPAETGVILGTLTAVCGILAHSTNGFVIDYMMQRGYRDGPIRFFVISTCIGLPFAISAFLVPTATAAFVCLFFTNTILTPVVGYGAAAIQMVMPPRMRGKAGAIYLACFNIIGLGLGPLIVGYLTDSVFGAPTKLGYSLITLLIIASPAAALLLWSARTKFVDRLEGDSLVLQPSHRLKPVRA